MGKFALREVTDSIADFGLNFSFTIFEFKQELTESEND